MLFVSKGDLDAWSSGTASKLHEGLQRGATVWMCALWHWRSTSNASHRHSHSYHSPRLYTVTVTVLSHRLQLTYTTKLRVRRMRLGMTWDDLGWIQMVQGIKRAEDNPRNLNESKRLMKIHEKLYSLFYSAKSNDFFLFCFCSFTRMLAEGSAIRRRLGATPWHFVSPVWMFGTDPEDVWTEALGLHLGGSSRSPSRFHLFLQDGSSKLLRVCKGSTRLESIPIHFCWVYDC